MVGDWVEDLARLVFECSFMTLATVDADGRPWATPVEYACDEELRFYWASPFDARHSVNVGVNRRVAWSIYDRTYVPLVGLPRGLYGEGSVVALDEAELEASRINLQQWISWRDEHRATPRPRLDPVPQGQSRWRRYRVIPERLYGLHPDAHPDHGAPASWRVPVDLTDTFSRLWRSRLEG